MNILENIAISAAAGSGKTYQLTNRFISLLHLSEAPERIIALTFTRTAAGEFFDNIIDKLCHASESSENAHALSQELGIEADEKRYHHLLRLLIDEMHRLNLQTLDSFFFKVVSAFALELGLPSQLRLLDSTSEPRMHDAVRDSIVYTSGELDDALNEFWHAFKQATYGREERSIDRVVANFIDALYALYLNTPDPKLWGQTTAIWKSKCPWQLKKAPDWNQLADNFSASIPESLAKRQLNVFETAADKIRAYPVNEDLNSFLQNALACAEDIFNGSATIKVYTDLEITGPFCEAIADSLRAVVWHHLERALQNTQGVYRILDAYHTNYDRIVRQPGKLGFSDLTHLLQQKQNSSQTLDRSLIDYRLDASFDHWLFDEFQDTSRPQWQVVADLIDEIVQDDSGTRSFFYVGDTKQCLYLWRNSDDRLFHDIQAHYNKNALKIVPKPLSVSWRSAPSILDAVNTVFADQAAIEATFGTDAAGRWQRAWQRHSASPATESLSGYACWLRAQKDEGRERNELIQQILEDLQPLEKGMTVGILVRQNKQANAIAEFLREHTDLPIHTGSSVQPASDNAAGVALLNMLRLSAHPGDAQARGFLKLIDHSTSGTSLVEACPEFRERLLTQTSESAVRWASKILQSHLSDKDTRHKQRLDDLVDLARAYDREDSHHIDGLHDFLIEASTGEPVDKGSIVIETVHKSKGLEYDVVIFANEDKTNRSESRISPLLNQAGEAEWILEPIKKELMQADPELTQFLTQTESKNGFERLCTLYVAMTRAKRALYMISDLDRAHSGTSVRYLKDLLGKSADTMELFPETDAAFAYPVLWQTGDSNWHSQFKEPQSQSDETVKPKPTKEFTPSHPRLQLARPSEKADQKMSLARYFDLAQEASEFGTQVHTAFEAIETWSPELDFESLAGGNTSVQKALQRCFESAAIRETFSPRSSQSIVWRERAFACVEGDQYISGTFDRVTLEKSPNGTLLSAEILDFKTDRIHGKNTIEQATEHHKPQLEIYRQALAKIIGLPIKKIQLKLLFTDTADIVKW